MSIPFTLSSSFGAVSRAHAGRLVCFGLVGLVGTLVNTVTLACLVEFGAWDYLISAVVATELAIITNFVLNDRWTFRNRVGGAPWLSRLGRYNAVALGGMIVSLAVLAVLTHWLQLHYIPANLLAIGAATAWNYTVGGRFAWAPSTSPTPPSPVSAYSGSEP